MKLSILIATVHSRWKLYAEMHTSLSAQAAPYGDAVEILTHLDGKEISIGRKRQWLLMAATGTHVLFCDDDDFYHPHYIPDIMEALKSDPDCVGSVIAMTIDGRPHYSCVHSKRFARWSSGPVQTPGFGRVYQRGAGHRNAVRRSIALSVGFADLRFGEDEPYSNAVTALCTSEVMIERPGFVYRYSTAEPHAQKYGIQ